MFAHCGVLPCTVSVLVLVNPFNSSTWYLKYRSVKFEIGAGLHYHDIAEM